MSSNDSQLNPSAPEPAKRPELTVLPAPVNLNASLCSEELFSWRKPKSLQLAMQMGLSLAIVLFCGAQIVAHDLRDEDVSLYWGGIVGILGWWMPSPTSGNNLKPEAKQD